MEATDLTPRLPDLTSLALRGAMPELRGDPADLVASGLVAQTKAGYMLTAKGRQIQAKLVAVENSAADLSAIQQIYQRFLAVNGVFKAHAAAWIPAGSDSRFMLLGSIERCVDRVRPVLRRTAAQLPRFGEYAPRLHDALARSLGGELDYVVSPRVDSIHSIWMECHEDYLQTLGISREEEGSY